MGQTILCPLVATLIRAPMALADGAGSEPARRGEKPRRIVRSVASWAVGSSDSLRLKGRIAVVSPHLDDAVLSIGAALATASRAGAEITIVTVFAGDVNSVAVAGDWDEQAGFKTAGEAARARRKEDARACNILGVRPVWLPFSDEQYSRGGTDDEIFAALVETFDGAETVLIPGFPLVHQDHAWLARLIEQRGLDGHVGTYYVEQPYVVHADRPLADGEQQVLFARFPDHVVKFRACFAHRSQVRILRRRSLWKIVRYEVGRGGETVLRKHGLP